MSTDMVIILSEFVYRGRMIFCHTVFRDCQVDRVDVVFVCVS